MLERYVSTRFGFKSLLGDLAMAVLLCNASILLSGNLFESRDLLIATVYHVTSVREAQEQRTLKSTAGVFIGDCQGRGIALGGGWERVARG